LSQTALSAPRSDPTPIFDLFRGNHATELLVAAVTHFKLFEVLATRPLSAPDLQTKFGLADRPLIVLLTAMRAMGLIARNSDGTFTPTPIADEHLVAGEHDVSGYLGLAADSPGVREMVERLRTNRPAGSDKGGAGAAFIYRDGIESAMEEEASARRLTLALAGRAKNVAPALAERAPLAGARKVLDVAGGTGIYAFAMLRRYPALRAVILDRAEVLKVAREMATRYGVLDRTEFRAGDMFRDPLAADCDVILLSNVLHDWDVPQCRELVRRCADALPTGGRLLIHDVFLNDELDGPLPIALYSASLFSLTEGRAYSAAEYRQWLVEAGLKPQEVVPTLVHCGVLAGTKDRV
jgi:ubiquinone/menaquinone biosynthesis C-methylase UbiE